MATKNGTRLIPAGWLSLHNGSGRAVMNMIDDGDDWTDFAPFVSNPTDRYVVITKRSDERAWPVLT